MPIWLPSAKAAPLMISASVAPGVGFAQQRIGQASRARQHQRHAIGERLRMRDLHGKADQRPRAAGENARPRGAAPKRIERQQHHAGGNAEPARHHQRVIGRKEEGERRQRGRQAERRAARRAPDGIGGNALAIGAGSESRQREGRPARAARRVFTAASTGGAVRNGDHVGARFRCALARQRLAALQRLKRAAQRGDLALLALDAPPQQDAARRRARTAGGRGR